MIATIKHYLIFAVGRTLTMFDTSCGATHEIEVPCYGEGTDFAAFCRRPSLRVSMGTFEDGTWVVYVFDPADDRFGWAFNLDVPDFSERGYAPDPNWREQAA